MAASQEVSLKQAGKAVLNFEHDDEAIEFAMICWARFKT